MQAIYNASLPTDNTLLNTEPDLIGYWLMGEASNDGTMTNMESGDIVVDAPDDGDWSQVEISPADMNPTAQEEDWHDQVVAFGGGGSAGPSPYFKMRALKDPGPGYETWVVADTSDFEGLLAPGPIQVGTAVIADQWES